jgi:hypothetical protein
MESLLLTINERGFTPKWIILKLQTTKDKYDPKSFLEEKMLHSKDLRDSGIKRLKSNTGKLKTRGQGLQNSEET